MRASRRKILGALAGAATLPAQSGLGLARPAPHILWLQAWDVRNIGDVAHVPGALALLRRHLPEARVTLWAWQDLVFRGETARMARVADGGMDATPLSRGAMPDLTIVQGRIDAAGTADNAALDAAIASADLLVLGTAAGLWTAPGLMAFHRRTGKPFGIFAVTLDPFNFTDLRAGSADVEALRRASFLFTRETASLAVLAGKDVDGPRGAARDDPNTPVNEKIDRAPITVDLGTLDARFVPDTAFAFDRRDDAAALNLMSRHGLLPGHFACFVPRHRWTPSNRPTPMGDDRRSYNDLWFDRDHRKLLHALTIYVRSTGHKAVLAPETVYAIPELAGLRGQLPADVAAATAVLDQRFWLPDAAASLFARAAAVISLENHSPILAAGSGTPFLMLHQPEDSIKSQMFADIGLSEWLMPDITIASENDVAARMMRIIRAPAAARGQLAFAMQRVRALHAQAMADVRTVLRDGVSK